MDTTQDTYVGREFASESFTILYFPRNNEIKTHKAMMLLVLYGRKTSSHTHTHTHTDTLSLSLSEGKNNLTLPNGKVLR